MTVVEAIKARRSVAKFRPDTLPRSVIEQMLEAAVWAPNHRLTEPWRFYVLVEEGKRRFADIRRRLRAASLPNPQAAESVQACDRLHAATMATPALIAATVHQAEDPVTRWEDAAATFMAIQNLMLAAVELGVGTYLRTGNIIDDPELRALLSLEDDRRVLGIVYAGYTAEVPQKRRTPASERTVWL